MSDALPPCPAPPGWAVDWAALDAEYEWIRNLRGCDQGTVHHAEGDVWTHTRMVCEVLASLPSWRELEEEQRRVLFAAALLHDVAKPACRREETGGHVRFPNIVYVEVSEETLEMQNRRRPSPVPRKVLEKLLQRWEVPDLTEAHGVNWCVCS